MARPRKQVWEGETEDQPTYVVEDSQDTLSKAEYEALLAANNVDKQGENKISSSAKLRHDTEEVEKDEMIKEAAAVKQQVASIGRSTKRKLAKVVGDEEVEEEKTEEEEIEEAEYKDKAARKKDKKIRAKKAKKMKLSFDVNTDA